MAHFLSPIQSTQHTSRMLGNISSLGCMSTYEASIVPAIFALSW
jgi:hypothetical protein